MSRDYFRYYEIATTIANSTIASINQKEKVRDLIFGMVAEAYLDKSVEYDSAMNDYVKNYNKKYVK